MHWNCSNWDFAEKLYYRAIEADPQNPFPRCNLATFLWDVRKDFDNVEKVQVLNFL